MKAKLLDDEVTVYEGTSFRSRAVTKFFAGDVIAIEERQNDSTGSWNKITLGNGDIGFIPSKCRIDYLDDHSPASNASPSNEGRPDQQILDQRLRNTPREGAAPPKTDIRILVGRITICLLVVATVGFVWLGGIAAITVYSSTALRDTLNSDFGFMASFRAVIEGRSQGLRFEVASALSTFTLPDILAFLFTLISFFPFARKSSDTIQVQPLETGGGTFHIEPQSLYLFLRSVRYIWTFSIVWHLIFSIVTTEKANIDFFFLSWRIGAVNGAFWAIIWGLIIATIGRRIWSASPKLTESACQA